MPMLLSFVVPCYNEEDVIEETVKRLQSLAVMLAGFECEWIFIDDGSQDNTRLILKQHRKLDERVKIVGFARNFGHQIAVSAGIDEAEGDAVIVMDADLQDPPEAVCGMVAKWREGYDVVYGVRLSREGESYFKRTTAKWFYRTLNSLSDIPIPLDTGDFRLMNRKVVDVFKSMPEHDRFIRGMVSWIGFKQTAFHYERSKRFAGTSKYPLLKMLHFATDGIVSFSSKPLRLSVAMGALCATLALIGIFYTLYIRLFTHTWVEGWATLFIAILFIGGIQLITIGILGTYIGRIYNELKRRPLYVVDEKLGFSKKNRYESKNNKIELSA